MAYKSHLLGKQLCEALGLNPSEVMELYLRWVPNDIGKITVVHAVTSTQCEAMAQVIKTYELIERPQAERLA